MKYTKWIGAALLVCAGQVSALAVDFDLLNPVSTEGSRGNYSDALDYQSGGLGLRVTGWSSGGDRYNPLAGISSAQVGMNAGGLGVERRGGVRGNIDNLALDFDFLMLEFDSAVSLSSVGVGYIPRYADSDVSIGAIDEFSVWSVGNIYDAELGRNDVDTTFTASTWLIGAFHPMFGISQDFSWDAFRIDQISVNVSAVPLPASVWFFATGLALLGYFRRTSSRRTSSAA